MGSLGAYTENDLWVTVDIASEALGAEREAISQVARAGKVRWRRSKSKSRKNGILKVHIVDLFNHLQSANRPPIHNLFADGWLQLQARVVPHVQEVNASWDLYFMGKKKGRELVVSDTDSLFCFTPKHCFFETLYAKLENRLERSFLDQLRALLDTAMGQAEKFIKRHHKDLSDLYDMALVIELVRTCYLYGHSPMVEIQKQHGRLRKLDPIEDEITSPINTRHSPFHGVDERGHVHELFHSQSYSMTVRGPNGAFRGPITGISFTNASAQKREAARLKVVEKGGVWEPTYQRECAGPESFFSTLPSTEDVEMAESLQKAKEVLDHEEQEFIRLHYVEGISMRELAQMGLFGVKTHAGIRYRHDKILDKIRQFF